MTELSCGTSRKASLPPKPAPTPSPSWPSPVPSFCTPFWRQGATCPCVCCLYRKPGLPPGDLLLPPWPETGDGRPLTGYRGAGPAVLFPPRLPLPLALLCGSGAVWETLGGSANPITVADTGCGTLVGRRWPHRATSGSLCDLRSPGCHYLQGKIPDKLHRPLLAPLGVAMSNSPSFLPTSPGHWERLQGGRPEGASRAEPSKTSPWPGEVSQGEGRTPLALPIFSTLHIITFFSPWSFVIGPCPIAEISGGRAGQTKHRNCPLGTRTEEPTVSAPAALPLRT